ncbi:MAG: hypothetical protein K5639_00780 [Eubacterium sp.]|nr:hypothetical protein [Eubacterium sp.]
MVALVLIIAFVFYVLGWRRSYLYRERKKNPKEDKKTDSDKYKDFMDMMYNEFKRREAQGFYDRIDRKGK